LRPSFLAAVERNPRMACFCQSVDFTISARVAPFGRSIGSRIFAPLLSARGLLAFLGLLLLFGGLGLSALSWRTTIHHSGRREMQENCWWSRPRANRWRCAGGGDLSWVTLRRRLLDAAAKGILPQESLLSGQPPRFRFGHCPTTLAPSECVVIQASGLLSDLPLDTGTCIVSSLGTLLHMCDSLGL
jgi:hypothetical protein